MIVDIVMPKMGESIMEGTILKWLKKPGDRIERDENLLEISTDKVDTEVPSPEAGVITELLYSENDVVEVGKVLARLETEEGAAKPVSAPAPKPKEEIKQPEPVKPAAAEKPAPAPAPAASAKTSARFYSPLVMKIAGEENVSVNELDSIQGTGAEGRVTKKDILDYIGKRSSQPGPKAVEAPAAAPAAVKKPAAEMPKMAVDYNEEGLSIMEFDNVRQKMAEHMVMSASVSPHVNSIALCDFSRIDKIRKEMQKDFESKEGFKITYMPFIADAVIKALKDFPLVNAVVDDSTVPFKAIMRSRVNLGLAVAMENGGLIVPVIKDADGKNLTGIARSLRDLGNRARIKRLTLDEIQGGTFTISNYGVFGNDIGTMIINQPQVAILGVGAVKKRAAVVETDDGDLIAIKPSAYLTLSFDHRLIDGALGGKFLMRVIHYIENYQI
jgi:2-oxoglutarate dehydrogenase E2 component (dihydrolipoamide succinyltransferase)